MNVSQSINKKKKNILFVGRSMFGKYFVLSISKIFLASTIK